MYRATISALLIVLLASTGALAASSVTNEVPGPARPVTAPKVSTSHQHECCHPVALKLELIPPQSPGEMPCGGQHSCCMHSAPEYTANVSSTLTWERLGAVHHAGEVPAGLPSVDSSSSRAIPTAHLLPYARLSTILRI